MRDNDDNNLVRFNSGRFFHTRDGIYCETREVGPLGPFASMEDAHAALQKHLAKMSWLEDLKKRYA